MPHAIRIHETGGPEVLRWESIDLAAPSAGEVQVRNSAIGLNYIDTYHRCGLYPLPSLPHGIGVEAAGIVEAVGPGVRGVQTGDRVAYVNTAPGTYATHYNLPANRLVHLPPSIEDEDAAASLLKGLTVEYLIRRCFRVEAGMTVLFHAAAGGVGRLACQWLSSLGATVIGTVGSEEKAQIAREHGCDHPIIYDQESVVDRVRALTDGKGVPVVYDSVGRATFDASLDALAPRGTLVSFGNASGPPPSFDPMKLAHKGSLFLTRPSLWDYVATREELLLSAQALFERLEAGDLKVRPQRRWRLQDAPEAHRALEARQTTGSSILLPD